MAPPGGDPLHPPPRGLPLPSHHEAPCRSQGHIHAEQCFLYWFHDRVLKVLSPGEECKVTWYMSWSPCNRCAEQVADFLATHHNLSLAIFSSRFYSKGDPNQQKMLCRLVQEGARMAAMDLPGEGWAPMPEEGMWVCHPVKGVCPGSWPRGTVETPAGP